MMPTEKLNNINKAAAAAIPEKPSATAYDVIKRILDVICSVLALAVFMPALLIICLVIALDDPGNPLFIQDRVGKDGRIFRMIKFRTMHTNAEDIKKTLNGMSDSDGVHFKLKDDPRITRVGKLLRASSIDELPQLLNVIKGDMSVIGPRPFIPEEQALLPDERLYVLPGLSCYWQVTDHRNMPIDEQLELDYKYIRERSLLTDIKLVLKTLKVVLKLGNS